MARAASLRQWIDSGAYGRILAGDYPRRDDDRAASVTADAKEAAQSYREAFANSQDPLMSLLRRFGDGASSTVGDWVGSGTNRVRDWMNTSGGAAAPPASGNDEGPAETAR